MLVTVITVCLNSEGTIARTIESVLRQTYAEIEYIIVDGASRDHTVEIVERYKDAFREKGWNYVIVSEPDSGMYDALNKGARIAAGELVGQINADDWYEPDAVETMAELYRRERYDAGWGSIRVYGKSVWIKHARLGLLWTTAGWCHPAMFSRREMLLAFPYPLESMYDDFDYITAVKQSGGRIVTIDKVASNFTFGEGGMSTRKSLREVKRRVDLTYRIYRKYGMSRLYLPYRWAYELAKFIVGRIA